MIKQPTEQTLEHISTLAKAVGGDGSFHLAPVYVCDNCKDESKEAFPVGVYDAQGKFWNDLCNDCWDTLICSVEDNNKICPVCGCEMVWVDCWQCWGEGYYDETEIDPLEGDEFARCPECNHDGGWFECPNTPHLTNA